VNTDGGPSSITKPEQGHTTLDWSEDPAFEPRTELGEQLREARRAIIRVGLPLLTWDEIEHEVAERRGNHYPDEDGEQA